MRKKHILLLSCLAALPLCAQNFNESVEVTNELIIDMSDVQRKTLPIDLPDSLSDFRLRFDYAVFEKPYKGAYEFSPYKVLLKPVTREVASPSFVLKAGAGNAAEFDLLYSPDFGSPFSLDIYNDLDSYFGPYVGFRGQELSNRFGIGGKYSFKNNSLSLNVEDRSIFVNDAWNNNAFYNRFGLELDFARHKWMQDNLQHFYYDLSLSWHNAVQSASLQENRFDFDAALAFPFRQKSRLNLDFKVSNTLLSGEVNSSAFELHALPSLLFKMGEVSLKTGAGLSYFMLSSGSKFKVWPDVRLDIPFPLISQSFFAGVGGGVKLNSYSSLKEEWSHLCTAFTPGSDFSVLNYEKLNAYFGMKGYIDLLFYEFKTGWKSVSGSPLWSVNEDASAPLLLYGQYKSPYAQADLLWQDRRLELSASLLWQKTDIAGNLPVYDLPAFSSSWKVMYNLMQRLYLGAQLEQCSARRFGQENSLRPELAGWWDLGLCTEWRMDGNKALWLSCKNLLNNKIEQVPCIVRRGWLVSGGISLIF